MLFEKAEKKPSKVEKSPYLIKMFLKNAKFPTKKILINPPIIFVHGLQGRSFSLISDLLTSRILLNYIQYLLIYSHSSAGVEFVENR